MRILSQNRSFLIVSFLIVISNMVFVGLNHRASFRALEKDMEDWAQQAEKSFNISLTNKAATMEQLATFVAGDPRVAALFEEGKKAVLSEGGGAGKHRAAFFRKELFELVNPGWKKMSARYDVRQLHFHIGPGATSFLRVHRPEKYGDALDNVRHTVVEANQTQKPTRGFETGRVYSGIRGVVPVFSTASTAKNKIHIGALEAGTSFTVLLRDLKNNLGNAFAVLLYQEHVHRNMWQGFIDTHFTPDQRTKEFFIEATTENETKAVLNIDELTSLLEKTRGAVLIQSPLAIQVCVFPLRDFKGSVDQHLADSGKVVAWRDVAEKMATFNRTLKTNALYAVLALVIVEGLLYSTWEYSRKKLQAVIDIRTQELSEANSKLTKMALSDGLTGLANRRLFDQHLYREWRLNARYSRPMSIIMADIDYFKRFNDAYGHPEGDECLKKVARALQRSARRPTDFVARYGGEEFVLVLSDAE